MTGEIAILTTAENQIVKIVANKIRRIDLGIKRSSQGHGSRSKSKLDKKVTTNGIRVIASAANKNAVANPLSRMTQNSMIDKNRYPHQRLLKKLKLRSLNRLPELNPGNR
jgi:hypothetical protein